MISEQIKWKMESEAEFGLFYFYHKISKSQAEELRKEGFEVTDSKETKSFPRNHRIFWGNARIEGEIASLNEKSEEYSLPQKLWIITMKNRPN